MSTTYLEAMTGVDLTQIDGIDSLTALKVISEIGLDMTRWPTSKHFASWLGVMSGQQHVRGQTLPDAEQTVSQSGGDGLTAGGPGLSQQSQCLGGLLPSDAGPAGGTQSDYGDRA